MIVPTLRVGMQPEALRASEDAERTRCAMSGFRGGWVRGKRRKRLRRFHPTDLPLRLGPRGGLGDQRVVRPVVVGINLHSLH